MKFLDRARVRDWQFQYLLLTAPVLVLLLAYAPTHFFFENQYDDSYITYRYAINFAEGHGLVFNIGECSDSASSFLYTLILSAFWSADFRNLEFLSGAIGIFSVWIIALYVYKLAIFLTKDRFAGTLVAAVCGLNGFLTGWALSGMETLFWSAVVLVSLYWMITEADQRKILIAILIAVFTRFEGIFLIFPYALFLMDRRARRSEFSLLFLVLLIFGCFYVVKHLYYGVWISHAFWMKEIASYYRPSPEDVAWHWIRFCSFPAIFAVYALKDRVHRPILFYAIITFVTVAFGPKSDWSRYSVHLLPLVYGFSAVGICALRSITVDSIRHITLSSVAVALALQAGWASYFNWRNMTNLADHQICRKELGKFIEDKIPNDQTIASSDLGAISYMAVKHRFVDLIALTSGDVLSSYQRGSNADSVLVERRVEYIADTFVGNDKNRLDALLAYFPKIESKSSFQVGTDKPLFKCSVGDVLSFQLSRLEKKADL